MKRNAFGQACGLIVLLVAGAAATVHAHKLSPTGTAEERRLSGVGGSWLSGLERYAAGLGLKAFGEPVHEEITNRIYGCDGNVCSGLESTRAPAAVLAGLRWNDDPPFRISSGEGKGTRCKVTQTIRFQTQPYCWYQLFDDANDRAADGAVFDAASRSAMLYRTHFGDLQFLHAMASADGVDPAQTQRMMLDWAEFNWRIMRGEYRLDTRLKDIPNEIISSRFGRTDWYVQDLYTLGSPGLRQQIDEVAFGSILHTLQDSFAEGHVDRASAVTSRSCSIGDARIDAPGLITEFHAYNRQDHSLHAEADSAGALAAHLQDEPDVVDLGRQLLRAHRARRSWDEVRPFFECVYALSDSARDATPGDRFARP
ncbi:hypothetical protein ASD53_07560 [Lysobacter sp. Root559]|nr:hypothetical protein ASD53_07560 [Lysobacter sp. Root559]